jgi:hypothetical protein
VRLGYKLSKANGDSSLRTITWSANTCRYSDADVFLGIAPGMEEDALRKAFGPDVLHSFPSRAIRITSQNAPESPDTIVLRLLAVRDASVVSIQNDSRRADVPGFRYVKLVFNSSLAAGMDPHVPEVNEVEHSTPSVIAFLLTIGLTAEQEQHFFNGVVTEFLDRSWSSLPQLLREVGCMAPSDAA